MRYLQKPQRLNSNPTCKLHSAHFILSFHLCYHTDKKHLIRINTHRVRPLFRLGGIYETKKNNLTTMRVEWMENYSEKQANQRLLGRHTLRPNASNSLPTVLQGHGDQCELNRFVFRSLKFSEHWSSFRTWQLTFDVGEFRYTVGFA